MFAASLVLSTGADAIPAFDLAMSFANTRDDVVELSSGDSRRAKKRPPQKSRIIPKRKKRTGLTWGGIHQPLSPLVPLQRSPSGCPSNMALIGDSYCVDVFEASLVEHLGDGDERAWPYYQVVPADAVVRAVSLRGVFPQGYISGL